MTRRACQITFAILALLAEFARAYDVPKMIAVTVDRADALGFSVAALPCSNEAERDVVLSFPRTLPGNKTAVRVQVFLTDRKDKDLFGASADYPVGAPPDGGSPSVLASYRPEQFDIGFTVQYRCSNPPAEDLICEAYQIRSVEKFLSLVEKRTPHNQRMQTDEPRTSPSQAPPP